MIVAIKHLKIQLIQNTGSLNIGATVNIIAQSESMEEGEEAPIQPTPPTVPQPVVPT